MGVANLASLQLAHNVRSILSAQNPVFHGPVATPISIQAM